MEEELVAYVDNEGARLMSRRVKGAARLVLSP
jgi:hypothetical protein